MPGPRDKFEKSFMDRYPNRQVGDALAGGLRDAATGAGVDLILAGRVQIQARGLPSAVCEARRAPRRADFAFDDCAYADTPEVVPPAYHAERIDHGQGGLAKGNLSWLLNPEKLY